MSFAEEQDAIVGGVDDEDERFVKAVAALVLALRHKVLLLSGIALGGAMQLLYYRQLLDQLSREMDSFQAQYLAEASATFEKMWNSGASLGAKVAAELGAMEAYSEPLDKGIYQAYVMDEAKYACDRLRSRLTSALSTAALSGGDFDSAFRGMGDVLNDAKTVRSMVSRASSALVGAANKASYGFVASLVERHPALASRIQKVWNWSNVQRPYHAAIDGTAVPFGELFRVPGLGSVPSARMKGPHDPSAPLGQVLNCKCFLTFEVSNG